MSRDVAGHPPKVGTRLTVRIDRLSVGGEAVGRAGSCVVFVPYGCPGDEMEVEVTAAHPRYVRARIRRLLTPSPQRTIPPCPYHYHSPGTDLRLGTEVSSIGALSPFLTGLSPLLVRRPQSLVCGGCAWQHLTYETQLEAKRRLVAETLERIGKVSEAVVQPTLGMATPWRYRNKVQQPVGWDGRRIISGFYAPFTHQIVPIEDCLVQPELSVRILNRTRALLEQFGVQPYDPQRHRGWVRHLLVRVAQDRVLLVFVTRTLEFPHGLEILDALRREFPALVGVHQNVNPARTNVILGPRWRKWYGVDALEEQMETLQFRVSPGSFFQVNASQAEVLCQVVRRMVGSGGKTLLDLYCGVGSFGLSLAAQFREVIGVDEVPGAIEDAQANARRNQITHVRFSAEPVERFLVSYQRSVLPPEEVTVILDPPRSGCSSRVLHALCQLQPVQIIYVSCDPGTLARDLTVLTPKFRVRTVQPVDLFPHTPHVETVAQLINEARF